MSAPPAEPGVEIKRGVDSPALHPWTPEERARIEASLRQSQDATPRRGGLVLSPARQARAETAALRERVAALETHLMPAPLVEFRIPSAEELEKIKAELEQTLEKTPFPPPRCGIIPDYALEREGLQARVAALEAELAALKRELDEVKERIRALERRR